MDELSDEHADEAVSSSPDATFAAVVDLRRSWDTPAGHNTTAVRHLRGYVDAGLNGGDSAVWDQDIVERRRGSSSADLVVNGEIGVKLVGRTGSADPGDLTVVIRLLAERHNYLVIYWLDTSPAGTDYRRNVERGTSAAKLDLKRLEFVGRPSAESGSGEGRSLRVSLAGVKRPLFVGILSALGTGIVTWLFTQFSGLSRDSCSAPSGYFSSRSWSVFLSYGTESPDSSDRSLKRRGSHPVPDTEQHGPR